MPSLALANINKTLMQNINNPSLDCLTNYSDVKGERDWDWDALKSKALLTSALLKGTEFNQHSIRMENCANRLIFYESFDKEGKGQLKLKTAYLCHVRQCPICEKARNNHRYKKIAKVLPEILAKEPTSKILELSLTIKNPPLCLLRSTIDLMNAAFTRLLNRKELKDIVLGYIRVLEVTKSKNDDPHPHFHVLLLVKASYFGGRRRIKQETWKQLWQECLQVDYTPQLDVKIRKEVEVIDRALKSISYLLKGSNIPIKELTEAWLVGYTKQMEGVNQIARGGTFSKLISDKELTNSEFVQELNEEDLVIYDYNERFVSKRCWQ
jgi:plasmid rolling circle replication initiator protein Rep